MIWKQYESPLEPPDSWWGEPEDDDDHDQDASDLAKEQDMLDEQEEN